MTAEPDTLAVAVTLLALEHVRDRGRLKALAAVEIDLGGIVISVYGVRLMARPDGQIETLAPCYRHPRPGCCCRPSACRRRSPPGSPTC